MYNALLLRRVISAAKPLFGPATFPAPSYTWPLQFSISRTKETTSSIKKDARFFPVRPILQWTKDIKSSWTYKLESIYHKTSVISSLFAQFRALSAIILYKPLFLTSSIILPNMASHPCLIKSVWDSLEIYVTFLTLFSRLFLRCLSLPAHYSKLEKFCKISNTFFGISSWSWMIFWITSMASKWQSLAA